jgi:hypothetical protein
MLLALLVTARFRLGATRARIASSPGDGSSRTSSTASEGAVLITLDKRAAEAVPILDIPVEPI